MIRKKQQLVIYLVLAIAAGFILLTLFVLLYPSSRVDTEFSQEIQEFDNPLLDLIMTAVSWPGTMPYSPAIVLCTAATMLLYGYKREAAFTTLTMLSGLLSTLVKLAVNRPRPAASLVRIVGESHQQSFPSGHVMFYIIFFGFLTLLMYRLRDIPGLIRTFVSAVCLLMIFLVPFSRIYLGAHWFTDVLGGLFLGLVGLYILGCFYLRLIPFRSSVST